MQKRLQRTAERGIPQIFIDQFIHKLLWHLWHSVFFFNSRFFISIAIGIAKNTRSQFHKIRNGKTTGEKNYKTGKISIEQIYTLFLIRGPTFLTNFSTCFKMFEILTLL